MKQVWLWENYFNPVPGVWLGVDTRRTRWRYVMTWKGRHVFSGRDFRPGAGMDVDNGVVGLLGFLSLQRGDTDAEYFERYTLLQWSWSESEECEALRLWVYDREG